MNIENTFVDFRIRDNAKSVLRTTEIDLTLF